MGRTPPEVRVGATVGKTASSVVVAGALASVLTESVAESSGGESPSEELPTGAYSEEEEPSTDEVWTGLGVEVGSALSPPLLDPLPLEPELSLLPLLTELPWLVMAAAPSIKAGPGMG